MNCSKTVRGKPSPLNFSRLPGDDWPRAVCDRHSLNSPRACLVGRLEPSVTTSHNGASRGQDQCVAGLWCGMVLSVGAVGARQAAGTVRRSRRCRPSRWHRTGRSRCLLECPCRPVSILTGAACAVLVRWVALPRPLLLSCRRVLRVHCASGALPQSSCAPSAARSVPPRRWPPRSAPWVWYVPGVDSAAVCELLLCRTVAVR